MLAAGSAALAGWAARGGENPARSDVSWSDALLWTGATAAAMAVARLLARRGTVSLWERVRGDAPPA